MRRIIGALLSLGLLLGLCGCAKSKVVAVCPGVSTRSNDRVQLWQSWMASADCVASHSGLSEASDLAGYIRNQAAVASPLPANQYQRLAPDSPSQFVVVPLTSQDVAIGSIEQAVIAGPSVSGVFLPSGPVVYLPNPQQFSPLVRGLLLLHDGFLARSVAGSQPFHDDLDTAAKREVQAYEFIGRIVAKLGGRAYTQALEGEKQRIATQQSPLVTYDSKLDSIFGASVSDADRSFRITNLWFQAQFSLLEAVPQPESAKLGFMAAFLQHQTKPPS